MALRLRGLGGLAGLVLGFSPSYKKLLPKETNVVGKLEEATTDLAERFPALAAFRADILSAGRDDIVVSQKYFWDTTAGGPRARTTCRSANPAGIWRTISCRNSCPSSTPTSKRLGPRGSALP
jgi:hypothetical protein